ncbi:MAG: 30S ribosomal protein S15 [Candidatus Yanofskybacteria bacterium RIFCSPLOWO2_02_FULL_45_10]|uniref:Small ribosomal subunit protein uS15 n=2 Tax=Candidatus Yanofskyibacteriota TaxID=1752733 RepID=A0A1F8G3I1_9BACT|nr:MAG: 30S ribosomal protein S15 [Candidatus Yanofskybacteria bacterium RIFCSPHIGHO2_12_FULL_45_19b]OGN32706.1 MAG: 30S ribosomal protein S15 [Candidatus Yanofskybacteria bacterium RIFCSPLOWO2_02_FULL_45_10]
MLKAKDKTKIISKFSVHEKDTGSADVQVALFTAEIKRLTQHLQKHKKDNSSRIGLLKMVGKRRRLLEFLKNDSPKRYGAVIKELDLKR